MQSGQYANRRSRNHCLTVLSMKRAATKDGVLGAAPPIVRLCVPSSRGFEVGGVEPSKAFECIGNCYRIT